MSRAFCNRRAVKEAGRNFEVVGTGQTVRGVLLDASVIFPPDAAINPGDILRDLLAKLEYIVADTHKDVDHLTADIIRFIHRCSITRKVSGAKDAFGRSLSSSAVVASDVPIVFAAQERAVVPAGTDIKRGDMLRVHQINESYLVQVVSSHYLPGCRNFLLVKQDSNDPAAASVMWQ